MFGALQDRLPKELVLNNIKTIEEANKYIQETYLPRHNNQFSVNPASEESAFISWNSVTALDDILCLEEERIVQRDNTVRYKGRFLKANIGITISRLR